jgi:hypothetical protein
MRRSTVLLFVIALLTSLVVTPAGQAGSYGRLLDKDSAIGAWYDLEAATGHGRVRHPDSFTVVVKGRPEAGYLCNSNPYGCKELYATWDVACTKGGRVKSLQGGKHRSGKVVGHPRLPFKNPRHCTISAGGSLSYGAGGSVKIAIYYRN